MKEKYLIITAHPDDAEIAAGGTLAKLAKNGCKVKNLIVSIPTEVEIRKIEAKKSSNILGIEHEFLDVDHPCTVEDISLFQLTTKIDEKISEFQPDVIITHWDNDSHQDHRILSNVVQTCLRKYNCDLYLFEQINQGNIIKSNQFTPNIYVDISDFMNLKLDSIKEHKSQMTGYMTHYLEDVLKLGLWRGHQSKTTYAECFRLVIKSEL